MSSLSHHIAASIIKASFLTAVHTHHINLFITSTSSSVILFICLLLLNNLCIHCQVIKHKKSLSYHQLCSFWCNTAHPPALWIICCQLSKLLPATNNTVNSRISDLCDLMQVLCRPLLTHSDYAIFRTIVWKIQSRWQPEMKVLRQ